MRLPLAALAACLAMPALAEPQCAPRDVLTKHLADQFGEGVVSMGVNPQAMVEVWANLSTGTWSIMATTPAGLMCFIASGGNFEAVAAPKPGVDG